MKQTREPSILLIQGVSLPELLVGLVLAGFVLSLSAMTLINLGSVSTSSRTQSERRVHLNRALDYISNDVREARAVQLTKPSSWVDPSGYEAVFFLDKPYKVLDSSDEDPANDKDNVVGYYVKTPSVSEGWRTDKVIYRVYHNGSQYVVSPLVDGITNAVPPSCTGGGTVAGNAGLRVNLESAATQIQICLQGKTTADKLPYVVSSRVSVRNF
ncbi:hypothetical protein [Lyngbya confervoides]|uniref:Prepilin-type N-terminal cleavage/methylation domain-containing protein n=1 Tax=Lyngbya confervoides BDU141951 TaxID=1574623 RepID=A0ABD4T6L2_9CYAN|nr:hypothetical protein [Lyngbya confervoides]MCM1984202.1 hypothetical protein [Lyngbya confervoides BDU141951]